MPEGYLCYDPPAAAPEVGPLPAIERGYATFASFNNLAKITPEVIAAWAQVLHRTPRARMLLKYKGLGDETVRRRLLDAFGVHGIEPQRLELLPPTSFAEYLTTYNQVDLVLDCFPFSGSTTTCEALWMGVPVVTWPGETFASRHSFCHLSNIGLTDTIGHSMDEYVERAVALASDLPRLAALRTGLRPQMAASPLCDGPRFAGHLVALLREAWRAYCIPLAPREVLGDA
jgi:predicted O-linked N-acetylglucosamine transferase (SPINDLY family)